mgnify:CR=1 FL=1
MPGAKCWHAPAHARTGALEAAMRPIINSNEPAGPTEDLREAPTLWPVRPFAQAHGVSERQTYKLLKAGLLEGVKIGRRTLITDSSRRWWLGALPKFKPQAKA